MFTPLAPWKLTCWCQHKNVAPAYNDSRIKRHLLKKLQHLTKKKFHTLTLWRKTSTWTWWSEPNGGILMRTFSKLGCWITYLPPVIVALQLLCFAGKGASSAPVNLLTPISLLIVFHLSFTNSTFPRINGTQGTPLILWLFFPTASLQMGYPPWN